MALKGRDGRGKRSPEPVRVWCWGTIPTQKAMVVVAAYFLLPEILWKWQRDHVHREEKRCSCNPVRN